MKKLIFVLVSCLLGQFICAQNLMDTVIQLKEAKVVEIKVPEAYKTTQLDSESIASSVNLAELLQEHSPVFVKSYGSGSLASVSFRGTGASHTSVLWNDISLNSPMNGQIDFSLFPTLFFDQAELHHGASGLIDGNGALGGSVVLNNGLKFHKGFAASLGQSFGSFNNSITGIKISNSTNKWLTETKVYLQTADNNFKYVNTALQDQPTVEQNKANVEQYGFQQAIYRQFKTSTLGIRFWYFNSDRMLPPSMQVAQNDENQQDESVRALIEWKGIKGGWQYKWVNSVVWDELIYTNTIANINSENHSYIFNSKLLTKYYLNVNFTITNDFSLRNEIAKADGYGQTYQRFNNTWLLGLKKVYNRFTFDVLNRFSQVGDEIKPLSPTAGISYALLHRKQLRLKANGGINYNFPSFNDLYWTPGGNPNLKPEYAQMIEFGANYQLAIKQKTSLKFETTLFYSNVNDWIIWQPTASGLWSPQNLREVENKGLELSSSLKTTINNKLKLSGRISYNNTYSTNMKAQNILDNSVNKQLIYVPYHQLNFVISVGYQTFSLMYNATYTGKRFITTDNSWYMPSYIVSDVALAKTSKLGKHYELNFGFKVNNIFNQTYQSIAWRAMPGRNYMVSIKLNYK